MKHKLLSNYMFSLHFLLSLCFLRIGSYGFKSYAYFCVNKLFISRIYRVRQKLHSFGLIYYAKVLDELCA